MAAIDELRNQAQWKNQQFSNDVTRLLKGKSTALPRVTTAKDMAGASENRDLASALSKRVKAPKTPAKKKKASSSVSDGLNSNERMMAALAVGIADGEAGLGDAVLDKVAGPMSWLQRPLDIVSRPAYTVTSALKESVEAINEGEPIWSLGDDIGYGAWRGLSGQEKSGFGDVVNEVQKGGAERNANPDKDKTFLQGLLSTGEVMDDASRENPEALKWFKRGTGLFGDVVTDPTTYLSLGATTAAKEVAEQGSKAIIKNAAVSTGESGLKNVVQNAVRKVADVPVVNKIKVSTGPGLKSKKVTVADSIMDGVMEHVDNLVVDISAGAQKGKQIGTREALRSAAQKIATDVDDVLYKDSTAKITAYLRGEDPTNMVRKWTPAKIAKTKADDDIFRNVFDEVAKLNKADPQYAAQVDRIVKENIEQYTQEVFDKTTDALENALLKVPTVRMFGKDIVALPKVGKIAERTFGPGTKANDFWKSGPGRAFSHTSNFIGKSSILETKAVKFGIDQFEKSRSLVDKAIKAVGLNDKDLRTLQLDLEAGRVTNPVGQEIADGYAEIARREVAGGIRDSSKAPIAPDYTYIHIKHGPQKKIDQFYKERKLAAERGGIMPGIDRAKQLGLTPEENAAQNYFHRLMKSNRDLTKAAFTKDLAAHYGIKSSMSAEAAAKLNLTDIGNKKFGYLVDPLKTGLKQGEELYLDSDMAEVLDKFIKMTAANTQDEGAKWLIDSYDYVLKKFKTLSTVYFPAYHMKNIMGDMIMGSLDGVTPNDYRKVFNAFDRKMGSTIKVGPHEIKFDKLLDDYNRTLNGGFMQTDVGASLGKNKVTNWIHAKSEFRENVGRSAHFLHAMDEEYAKQVLKVPRPRKLNADGVIEEAWNKAVDASIFRVNKYKFDFNALTPVERKFMRRGVPFYTYLRKAAPAILEATMLSPRNLSYINKIQDGLGEGDLEGTGRLSQWLRESGFSQIPGLGGKEPWGLTNEVSPAATLQGLNPKSWASSLSPAIQLPMEIKSGKDTFSGREIKNPYELITNKLRPVSFAKTVVDPSAGYAEMITRFLGLPVRKVTTARQESAMQNLAFQLKGTVDSWNEKIESKGYKVYVSNRNGAVTVRIKNADGEVVGDSISSKWAKKMVDNLAAGRDVHDGFIKAEDGTWVPAK